MNAKRSEGLNNPHDSLAVSDDQTWIYVQRGETYGPVNAADLRAAAYLGFLGPQDLVRRSDRNEWTQARSITFLFKTVE